MKVSFVATDVNLMSDGTPSLAWMTVCTLRPPFFFSVLGCLPTPLNNRFENSVIVVESMICSRFIHLGCLPPRLSAKMITFAHGYSVMFGDYEITKSG